MASKSIEVGSKVKSKGNNPYGFRRGAIGEVVEVFPFAEYKNEGGMFGVLFENYPDPTMTKGWNMLGLEIEEV